MRIVSSSIANQMNLFIKRVREQGHHTLLPLLPLAMSPQHSTLTTYLNQMLLQAFSQL
jgi:hypothetical protein